MTNVFRPELLAILTLALIILGTLAVLFYQRVLKPRFEATDFYQRYNVVLGSLADVVSTTVLRIAFSKEDLSEFQEEANATGRDVRLVAAIHFVSDFAATHGIALDENLIVSSIEAHLALFKSNGTIPTASPPDLHSASKTAPPQGDPSDLDLFRQHLATTYNIV